jgi:acetolactate synthase-1/2/3 large subunit
MTPMDNYMGDLAEAKRPGILVGGGAYKARSSIMAFAERHGIPVFRTWNALDVATDDSPVYAGTVGTYGGPGRNFGIQNCDLLLILGCRVSGRITGGQPQSFAREAKRYWVDVDAALLAEHEVRPAHAVCMDAGEFVERLLDKYETYHLAFPEWLATCLDWLFLYDPVRAEMLQGEFHHYGFMRRLSERLPSDAIVVYDTGGNAIMMGHCFRSKRGQRIFASNGNTPMGFALCGAMGSWFTEPERPIICIIGDGGMSMNIQELQTIRHYEVPLKIFVVNNHILGNTKSYQRVNKKPELACGPDGYSAPNFMALAYAYGLDALSLGEWERFGYVVERALAGESAVVVDVVHHDFCNYEPRLSRWDAGIEEMYPPLPRQEFLNNMIVQPLEGWETRR